MNWIIGLLLSMARITMAEAGGGAATVTPADAKAFVTNFVPDPKLLDGMADDQVLAYHGQVTKVLNDHDTKARESYDWRKGIAGDNADATKTLERFASPKALYESYDQLRTRLSKGELKAVTPFPEKGTAEQQTAWRAENGVPAAPGEYKIELPAGMVIGDKDKPAIESLTKYAHSKNIPGSSVNDVVNWYFQERVAREEAARADFDNSKKETAAELGNEWGGEYKANINKIQGVIDATIPNDQAELKVLINNAIATNPHFARHYAAIALQLNPAGTLVPGDRGANEGTLKDEIAKIEKVMKTERGKYDKDEAMQKRYRELLGGYSKLTGKEWGAAA